MGTRVALELAGLEVIAPIPPILHRDDFAAAHAVAQLVGGAVEEAGRTRRAPEPFRGDGRRDDGWGERLAPEPLLKQPLQFRQMLAWALFDEGAHLPGQLHPNGLPPDPRGRQRVVRAVPCDRHARRAPVPCHSSTIRAARLTSTVATTRRRPQTRLVC
jgi:hypothetical protein